MPFVECLSGFAEVPYQVPPWSLPVAPRMPKNKPKEAYLVPAPKARLYPKVLIAKCLPGGAEGPYQGQPLSPRKVLKTYLVPGWKARLSARHVWKMQNKVGDGFPLMLDCYMSLNVPYSISLAKRLAEPDLHFTWMEEFLPPDEYDGYEQVRQAAGNLGLMLTTGEHEYSRFGFKQLIDKKVQLGLCKRDRYIDR